MPYLEHDQGQHGEIVEALVAVVQVAASRVWRVAAYLPRVRWARKALQ